MSIKTLHLQNTSRGAQLIYGQSQTGMWHILRDGVCFCGSPKLMRWTFEPPKQTNIWTTTCYPCFRAIYNMTPMVGWGEPYTSLPENQQGGYIPHLNCHTVVRKGKKRKRCGNSVDDPQERDCKLHRRNWVNKQFRHFSEDVARLIYRFNAEN